MDTTWTATFTGLALVEAWGAGGTGRLGDPTDIGGGGGGGEYGRAVIAVVLGNVYFIRTGQNAFPRESIFGTGALPNGITVNGGGDASFSTPGAGGTGGNATVLFDGGPGATSLPSTPGPGGGGGSSGSPSGPGVAGAYPAGGDNGPQAGVGGDGSPQNAHLDGSPGGGPGGGGGGAGSQTSGQSNGGPGAGGGIRIWKDNGAYPPAVLVTTFGTVPPPPTPPTPSRRAAFFM